jgi:hypothetical protein
VDRIQPDDGWTESNGQLRAAIAAGNVSQSHGFRYGAAPLVQLFGQSVKDISEREANFVVACIK